MVRLFVGSILHGGPIELFLVPARVTKAVVCGTCLWDDAYKRTLAANRKKYLMWRIRGVGLTG